MVKKEIGRGRRLAAAEPNGEDPFIKGGDISSLTRAGWKL